MTIQITNKIIITFTIISLLMINIVIAGYVPQIPPCRINKPLVEFLVNNTQIVTNASIIYPALYLINITSQNTGNCGVRSYSIGWGQIGTGLGWNGQGYNLNHNLSNGQSGVSLLYITPPSNIIYNYTYSFVVRGYDDVNYHTPSMWDTKTGIYIWT